MFKSELIARLRNDHSVYVEIVSDQSLTKEQNIYLLSINGLALQYIIEPTMEMRKTALKQTYKALIFIEEPTEDEILDTLRTEPVAIQYLSNPDVKMQLEAISKYTCAVEFIRGELSDETKILALIKNADYARFVDKVDGGILAMVFGFNKRFKNVMLCSLNQSGSFKGMEEFIIVQQIIYWKLIERYPLLVDYL